ncbi:DnaB-like helicase C-terminal domain-containing protein [Spirillospora sp. NPDC047279]|uniref:DnaB-like helicase C-terminal domain-containing protein n=1 Tax=Spirillospora sp. NPDC047279 TaxID=3155478 RepID=UPI0033E7F7DB
MGLYHLGSALRSNRSSGRPLKTVWKTLDEATAVFRKPQLVLIASAPGGGKSAFALNLAVKSEASCLYFSADSGPGTQLTRTVSILTGRETGEVQRAMEKGYTFDTELEPVSRIWWEFDAGPSMDLIEKSITAHGYLGAYPDMCVIDNLLNVDPGEEGNEYKSMENVLLFGLELARKRNMCVVVLAHLTGEYEDGTTIPPLSGLRGKVSKVPEMVLTLFREETLLGTEDMGVAIVKNRDGIANAAGRHTVSLRMDLNRMAIEDHHNIPTLQAA